MYIKSVMLDGFKSYAQRTEVNGFDPLFNAITGLNGSGKSNILDGICFLLGISNLSQVRATNLQELVYKNGQAGVTKATVSITFDNANKSQSPLGYEQYDEITVTRQVVIGGRNRYLINGTNAQNTRVQDLFRSVQLNVNNPHFLIMQGRITKVLNMKPPEILSMIEEAAGTKLYESKKEAAQKTIEKKDAKLKEIDSALKEEITPTISKLKEERSSYLEYQKITRELEHLNKLCLAYQFYCAEETCVKSADEVNQMKNNIVTMKGRLKQIDIEKKNITEKINDLSKKRDQEEGETITKLEAQLNEKQKLAAKFQSQLDHQKEALKSELKKQKDLKKQLESDKKTLESKRKEVDKMTVELERLAEQAKLDQERYAAAQKHFHAVTAGLSSNDDGADATLNEQLMAAKKEVSDAETDLKQSSMRQKHVENELKKKRAELKETEQGYKKEQVTLDSLKKDISKIQADLNKLKYEDGQEEKLVTVKRQLTKEIEALREQTQNLEARFPQFQFEYKDPEKNFDRSKVYGPVAKLFKVNDVSKATALEVSAGGKLFNVVVDTEETSKKLLQKGDLKRRCTIIPLNKIVSKSIPADIVKRAEGLVGKENVCTALSLIDYAPHLQSAMEFVFGQIFICKDMDTARKVAFDEKIMRKCVTLDGDIFDPSGTLTGGSRSRNEPVLVKLSEMMSAEEELVRKGDELAALDQQLGQLKPTANKWRQLNQQLQLKYQECELCEEKLRQTTHHRYLEEVNALETEAEQLTATVVKSKETKEKATKKAAELEHKLSNAKNLREQELNDAEKKMNQAKKTVDESGKKMKEQQQTTEALRLEMTEMEKELVSCESQLKTSAEAVSAIETRSSELTNDAKKHNDEVKESQAELARHKEMLKERSKEISGLSDKVHELQKESASIDLEMREVDHKIIKATKDSKDAAKLVEQMMQNHEWIIEEKRFFGEPNSAYDFKQNDPKDASRRVQKLQETKETLARNVNMRAMNMLEKAEQQYNDLMKKRDIVLNDKAKISAVIAELDEKKKETLKKAYDQVNADFGSIFTTLLPGTKAKLVAPEGATILDGLEVKIAFGDIWKESLSELSGGQRSLVALSLIFALLLFKPAPIYILDEVDAALDLSHTQNIGQMLRTHFQHSQFIVVSLKDGMFNNANVLFKTKFVDGISMVTRHTGQQGSTRIVSSGENDHNRQTKKRK